MPTVAEMLDNSARQLEPVTDTPRLDAEILLAHALGRTRAALLASMRESIEPPESFATMLRRRAASEPIAYILGEWEFYSLTFAVEPPVLVPRPETEHLVKAVLDFVNTRSATVLEIGTGTGCIAISIARNAPETVVTATDIRAQNLELASRNARAHGVGDRVAFVQGDLFEPVDPASRFDVICSNPPYVAEGDWESLEPVITRYEDPAALLAGADGLDVIRRLVAQAPRFLNAGSRLAFEFGMGQDRSVNELLKEHDYRMIELIPDLAGIPRVAVGHVA
jgi:release factor glutamine methyltransferase